MKRVIYLVCILVSSCNPSVKHATEPTANAAPYAHSDSIQSINDKWTAKSISQLTNYTWRPHHPDTTNYLCEIRFQDEYALYIFHGQCIYFFFTYTTFAEDYQQVQLEWTYKTDCMLDMSFLEKANGVKRHPKYGDAFATYRLTNDTTLSVEYKFPEWVQKINQIAQDSLFPQRLYIEKPHGS